MRGGSPDRGKCTIEVVVDDVAQVEIMGGTATLRTLSGQPSQWRRFECTSPMPPNPAGFRFAGVDGRGRQTLIREPRNGPAVVQIEDKQGGSEGYTFDLFWDPRGAISRGPEPGYPPPPPPGDYRDRDRDRNDRRFSIDDAVRVCQNAVTDEASRRFRTDDIHFRRTAADDRPGRQDWVTGTLDVRYGRREERYGFSCSMDFDRGRLRSVQLDDRPLRDDRR
jgi:hypothetical protein